MKQAENFSVNFISFLAADHFWKLGCDESCIPYCPGWKWDPCPKYPNPFGMADEYIEHQEIERCKLKRRWCIMFGHCKKCSKFCVAYHCVVKPSNVDCYAKIPVYPLAPKIFAINYLPEQS